MRLVPFTGKPSGAGQSSFCLSQSSELGPLLTPCMIGPHRDTGLSRPQPCPVLLLVNALLGLPCWAGLPVRYRNSSTYRSVRLPWTRPEWGFSVIRNEDGSSGERPGPTQVLAIPVRGASSLEAGHRGAESAAIRVGDSSGPYASSTVSSGIWGGGAILVWPSTRSATAWDTSSMR